MAKIIVDNQRANSNTGPLKKIKILKSIFVHAREDKEIAQSQIFINLGPQMA